MSGEPLADMRHAWILAVVTVFVGCTDHGRSAAEKHVVPHARTLVAETRPLWVRHSKQPYAEVPKSEYPVSVGPLKPVRIWTNGHGVFIETYSVFVATAGVFVRHDPAFTPPSHGGEPFFEPMAENIYWYEAPG